MRDFHNTVNVLVQAYIKGTLEHSECHACAVGNIINASGVKLIKNMSGHVETYWLRHIECTVRGKSRYMSGYPVDEAIRQIECTGYNANELSRIEHAFENTYWDSEKDYSADEWIFTCLMSVVDVLSDIHGIDLSVKEEAKLLFVK